MTVETAGRPDAAVPISASLDQMLADAVGDRGDVTLLDYFEEGIQVTYGEFADLVDRVAGRLHRAGVADGDRVGVMLPNGPLFPAMMFGIARLGAVIVPLNPGYRPAELDYVAGDCGITTLVVDHASLEGIGESRLVQQLGGGPACVVIDDHRELLGAPTGSYPSPEHGGDVMVAIQYTSGTTGFPKGCMLTHRYWTQAAATYASFAGYPRRVLSDSPFFYMSGPGWLTTTMVSGGTLLIPKRPSLRKFIRWLSEQRVDFCWFPSQLLALPPAPSDGDHTCRRAFCDNVPRGRHRELEERFGVVARDCYAMTETGTGTIVEWDDQEGAYAGSMGRPAMLRECQLIDEERQPIEGEGEGELCVRGPGMFLGYYDKDELNAELFLPGGWFRTGDRVRRDPAGRYFFVGRAKDMVRRNGENIAAAEVEHVLKAIPGVLNAAVVPVPDAKRGEEVKAYIMLADGFGAEDLTPTQVAEHCRRALAEFKVPRFIEYRSTLPLTPSEKVAKRRLVEEKPDLRSGSFDLLENAWH